MSAIQLFISTWEKNYEDTSFCFICSSYHRKHPNNDNKIFLLLSSSCFQHHSHDWFYVLRYNLDLSKLEWTLLLFNFYYARDFKNRRISIPVAEYASFSHQYRTLKVVKSRNHNEVKLPIGKIFRKYKPIKHYFAMSQKWLSCSFVNKVYDNYNKASYLQRNMLC